MRVENKETVTPMVFDLDRKLLLSHPMFNAQKYTLARARKTSATPSTRAHPCYRLLRSIARSGRIWCLRNRN